MSSTIALTPEQIQALAVLTGQTITRRPVPTVAEMVEAFLAQMTTGGRAYPTYARGWSHDFGERRLDELTPSVLRAWRKEALERHAPATIRIKQVVLSHLFRIATEDGHELVDPCRIIGHVKVKNERYKGLSLEEVARLKRFCRPDLREVVDFLVNTGLRVGEMLSAQWEHVEHGRLWVPPQKTQHGRIVPLPEAALAVWNRRRALGLTHPFPFRYQMLYNAFRTAAVRAGVSATLHSLRHTYASELVRRGAPIYAVSALLGHRSVELTTRRYAKLGYEQVEQAAKLLDA